MARNRRGTTERLRTRKQETGTMGQIVTRSSRRRIQNYKIVKPSEYNHNIQLNQNLHYLRSSVAGKKTKTKSAHTLDWSTIPSLPLIKIFSLLSIKDRQSIFLTSKYWSSICRNEPSLWQDYDYIIKDSVPISDKTWKRSNLYLTTFGGHIKRLNIKFEFGKNKHWYPSNVTNWNVQKIQNFLGIFNLIMTKPIKRKAKIKDLIIENFRFEHSQWSWNATVAPSWLSKREYARNYMPEWYIEIFIGLLCDFLAHFDRSCLDRISFKDMRLCSDSGLEVMEALSDPYGPCYGPLDLNLNGFFDIWLYPEDMEVFGSYIKLMKLRKLEIDGDMLDSTLLDAIASGSNEIFQQLCIEINDCYRQAEYPWNEDGSVTECINWRLFESKCINGKVNLIFQKRVCEHPNAKSIIKHYALNSTKIESIQLARHDVKRFNRYDFYNMRGSPRGSQVLVSALTHCRDSLRHLSVEMVDDKDAEIENVLTQYLTNRNNLISLRVTSFLTRTFMEKLLKSIKQANCPLEHLYVRAYSFQRDQNFVSKSALKREFGDVIQSLKSYDLISYSRSEELRSIEVNAHPLIQHLMDI